MTKTLRLTPFAPIRVIILAAAFVLYVALLGCGEEPPPAPVAVQPVKILEIAGAGETDTREFPGEIQAAQHAELAFENSGKLIELSVLQGQEVERGEVLARLDPRDFEAERDSENAKLTRAKADFERIKALFDADVASQQQLDGARSQFDVARAGAARALKSVEDDAVIAAPFSGSVARVLVENFQNVQAKEIVFLLQNLSILEVAVAIPESAFSEGAPGGSLEERNEDLQPRVTVSTIVGRSFPARLTEFSAVADPATRTFGAVVSFESPADVTILPGMTASVTVSAPVNATNSAAMIRIPAGAALADEQGNTYVWKVDPTSMQVSRSPVKLGPLTGESVEVTSGITAGDWIAVSGVHKLREGMTIRRYQG